MLDQPQGGLVRVYYLGGLSLPGSDEPIIITAKQMAFELPAAGGHIDVDENLADYLVKKYTQRIGPNGMAQVFTLNPNAVKTLQPVVIPASPATLSNEELLAELKARGLAPEPVTPPEAPSIVPRAEDDPADLTFIMDDPAEPVLDEAPVVESEEPITPRSPGRPKKSKE